MTAKSDLKTRKYKLIARIEAVQKEDELNKLEELVEKAWPDPVFKPLRKQITLEEILAEQNFRGFNREEIDKIIAEIGLEEPLEDLLAMLN
ncbi:MAG: hypothetical protein R2830_25695 [Saprospiraceae bacterium]